MEEINNVDINAWRHGYKWNINECLRLEREYDLLKLSVPEMAILHKRSINAIMCKLQDEGLDTYNNLYVKTFGQEGGTLEDHIDEQIDKLNNLSSFANHDEEDDEEDDDEDEDDENDEDYEDDEEDDEDDDEDEDEDDEDDDEDDEDYTGDVIYDDGSNHAYVYDQVKRMHKHITNLLGYFTKVSPKSNKSVSSNAY